ncbi:cysteine hydrolase family protein [Sciscionella marina]|uniref:cysteine hydrolase family protein n=1 Tax=Sciscionella marina TaxID=508770 RepID=UPI00036DE8A6|nr:isochorismatase family cysteine hydrolase [Sciscionella marina]
MLKQALLVMDVQQTVVGWINEGQRYAARLAGAVSAAREATVPVIHVVVRHRDGHPEVDPGGRFFASVIGTDTLTESNPGSEIHPAVAPRDAEPVVAKRFISAFYNSDLETLLRAWHIDTLVLTGLGTSGVVLGTLRDATERQYEQIVLSDGCDDTDAEVHRVLTEKVFPREAEVITIADWVSRLG